MARGIRAPKETGLFSGLILEYGFRCKIRLPLNGCSFKVSERRACGDEGGKEKRLSNSNVGVQTIMFSEKGLSLGLCAPARGNHADPQQVGEERASLEAERESRRRRRKRTAVGM